MSVVVEFYVLSEKPNTYRHVYVDKRIVPFFNFLEIVLQHVFEIDAQ
jgi:hypothetical protein